MLWLNVGGQGQGRVKGRGSRSGEVLGGLGQGGGRVYWGGGDKKRMFLSRIPFHSNPVHSIPFHVLPYAINICSTLGN